MEHTCSSISANHPWLVDDNRDRIVYTMGDPPCQHTCRIPPSIGRRIRGCYYGWVILSNHPHSDKWSLWNPETCNIIRLPRLPPRKTDFTRQCCLSSPPDDHGSVFMLTSEKCTIVFCQLDCNRQRLEWAEMSYAQQMKNITGGHSGFLYSLTSCNGKVYALNSVPSNRFVIHIDIAVKGGEIVISLVPYMKIPSYSIHGCPTSKLFLKGCCTELFYIELGLNNNNNKRRGHVDKRTVGGVRVFKLDMIMTNKTWERMEDHLKGAAFFLDLAHDFSVFYSPAVAVASELGGYIHFLDTSAKVTHSFDPKNKTIALSSIPSPVLPTTSTSHEHGAEMKSQQEEEEEENAMVVVVGDSNINQLRFGTREGNNNNKSRLVNVPVDILGTIMEFCVGIEYLNFRATCKQCHLAAPVIPWSKEGRLHTYSLVSPWLMWFDKDRGVISFTDPVFGDNYFIKTPQQLIDDDFEIHCSIAGWLLIRIHKGPLIFFNPFTSDIRELPFAPYFDTYSVSAPPTASDCMVVGFTTLTEWHVYIHFVAREASWRRFRLNFCGHPQQYSFHFATLYRQNLYALYNNGGLGYIDTGNLECTASVFPCFIDAGNLDYTWREGPTSSSCVTPKQSFLMKCDQQLLLVIVTEFGECVEVFKLNHLAEWEKTESLGSHAIYICGKVCLCVEAKTPEMANKIYFPRFHSQNRKIVFYSLATRRYHTSNIEESFGDFMGTEHPLNPHVWIEPSWL